METSSQPKRSRFSLRNILLASAGLLIVCVVCGVVAQFLPKSKETPVALSVADTASSVNLVATSTWTSIPKPTNTSVPTNTPLPTRTPRPTLTPTPIPTPVVYSGTGDSVVDVEKWEGPALAVISYTGSSNFVVWTYDDQGEQIDLLVNTIGNYQGTRPIEFREGEAVARFQIEADGNWGITLLPLDQIRRETIPDTIQGTGDEVVLITGGTPDLLKIDASQADSNFVVYSYSDNIDLLVNEIAPYIGTVIVPAGTIILEIVASGPWQIEVTAR